ncbi:thioesterase family protein [Agitococcus lubricus]|uniref:Putative thioesterase n=1 Tax=Agitococcus lubricus TaxID=1077255 RepID=A0A2T5J3N9_9GAMM|nr:thioesterase [Agitococcus lubricus]PTQ91220.1 putative thioesterase [Agitococcus lubricus]
MNHNDNMPLPTARATMYVTDADTAKAIAVDAYDDFPAVLATAKMVALMELAAARCLQPILAVGELSVGVGVDIQHIAATPTHVEVEAVATYVGREGKLYRFTIEAFDAGGKIGTGTHTRAIISTERLLAGAQQRVRPN